MNHPLTVMQALSQAGGLTPYAGENSIRIMRRDADNKMTSISYDYADVADGSEMDREITLRPGDVVIVPTASLF
jgi:polysaccharide export outer membrane protein